MTNLTQKQQKFIECKAAGMNNERSAVAAGYSANSAGVSAAKLMNRPDIKKAIKKLAANFPASGGADKIEDGMKRDHYADPKDFLTDGMNNKLLPVALRGKFALDLMPYMHGRIGEKGKKEKQLDAAHTVGKSKFGAKAAPVNNVVNIHK